LKTKRSFKTVDKYHFRQFSQYVAIRLLQMQKKTFRVCSSVSGCSFVRSVNAGGCAGRTWLLSCSGSKRASRPQRRQPRGRGGGRGTRGNRLDAGKKGRLESELSWLWKEGRRPAPAAAEGPPDTPTRSAWARRARQGVRKGAWREGGRGRARATPRFPPLPLLSLRFPSLADLSESFWRLLFPPSEPRGPVSSICLSVLLSRFYVTQLFFPSFCSQRRLPSSNFLQFENKNAVLMQLRDPRKD
jgi:hypothetical protein